MKRIFLALAAASFLSVGAQAASLDVPSGTYRLDKAHASILWKANHLGLSDYVGQLATFDATIELDAENVANSSVEATVQADSVVTLHPFPEQEDFDKVLAGPDWLNAGEHPEITFTSSEIEVTGDNTAIVRGDLSFNGQSHPFALEVTLNNAMQHPMAQKPALGIKAVGSFDRTDYGMTVLAGPVSENVQIEINAEFIGE